MGGIPLPWNFTLILPFSRQGRRKEKRRERKTKGVIVKKMGFRNRSTAKNQGSFSFSVASIAN
jgi:hypothetical protein